MSTTELASGAYGLYSETVEVVKVVRALNAAGFSNDQMFMMLAPTHPIAAILRDASFLDLGRQASRMTTGLIGWLAEFGAVVIPSVGFFIRSQAFFGLLVSGREAPPLSGNARTLEGLGFCDGEATRVESKLKREGFLVYVASPEAARVKGAAELFQGTGANESATLEQANAGVVSVQSVSVSVQSLNVDRLNAGNAGFAHP